MRILIVSQMTPYLPAHDGFRTLTAHLLQNLARHHPMGLITVTSPADTLEQRRWAMPFCAWTETVRPGRWRHPVSGAPAEALTRVAEVLDHAIERFAPDALYLIGGLLAPLARSGDVPTVLSIDDSRALRAREFRRVAGSPWAWARAALQEGRETAWERRWFGAADARIVVSDDDRAALAALGLGGRLDLIPTGVDVRQYEFRRAGQSGRIVFTGNLAWPPGIDAMRRFTAAIFPRIRGAMPRAELLIAGTNPVPSIRALGARPGVRVSGVVPDLRPSVWSAAVYVSPLRASFGLNNKILEAMALGTPVVASSRSLSGLPDVVDGHHVLLADDDEATAAAVLLLLRDSAAAGTLARNARALVERRYGWPAVARRHEAVIAEVARRAVEATA